VDVRILGPLELVGERGAVPLPGARARMLLLALVVRRGQALSAGRLADIVWGDRQPDNPANALQALVSRVRRVLRQSVESSAAVIESVPGGYRLNLPDASIDAARFSRAVDEGTRLLQAGDPAAASVLRRGLAEWRGDALPELADDPAGQAETRRLEELRLVALERRVEADLAAGPGDELVGELRALVAEHPLRERMREQLMVALYRSGRQTEALDVYRDLEVLLREELGLDPGPDLQALHRAVLAQEPALAAPAPPAARPATNLPQPLSSFVGRRQEMKQVCEQVLGTRLVTLIGPGGTGKTRLAVEAARTLLDDHPDGVWFVDLAPLTEPDAVLGKVAEAVGAVNPGQPLAATGVRPLRDRLVAHVRDRRMLVVLDNCEHLLEPAAQTTELLLHSGTDLRVLATSREGLRLPGEALWPVPPLAMPCSAEPDHLREVDAGRLFLDRVAAVRPDFRLETRNAWAVEEVCRRLDGLPLALELAAARAASLPVEVLARRLGDRFALLTGGSRTAARRQQTLEAVVEWSYELLDDRQRRVLRRLGVCAGGCPLEAAEVICAGDDDSPHSVLPTLSELADKSLVAVTPVGDGARYRLLETLREFALHRLVSEGDPAPTRRRHARWFADLAVAADSGLRGPGQIHWLETLEREHDNLRTALEWSVDDDPDTAVRIARALAWFWWLRDHGTEAVRWLSAATQAAAARDVDWGRARLWLGFHRGFLGRPAGIDLAEALAAATATEDKGIVAEGLLAGSYLRMVLGQPDAADPDLERAVRLATEAGAGWVHATARFMRANLELLRGRPQAAISEAEQAVAAARAVGDRWGEFQTADLLARVATGLGDYEHAGALLERADELGGELGLTDQLWAVRVQRGALAMLQGDLPTARGQLTAAAAAAHAGRWRATAAAAHNVLGMIGRRAGDLDAAERAYEQARRWLDDDSGGGAAEMVAGLVHVAAARGDAVAASLHLAEAVRLGQGSPWPLTLPLLLEAGADAALVAGDAETAGRRLGCAARLREQAGLPLRRGERYDVDRLEAAVRRALGGDLGMAAMTAGRDMEPGALLPR
jgi:predicted ATPase/DNA-binding SARP family transcriptional activator